MATRKLRGLPEIPFVLTTATLDPYQRAFVCANLRLTSLAYIRGNLLRDNIVVRVMPKSTSEPVDHPQRDAARVLVRHPGNVTCLG